MIRSTSIDMAKRLGVEAKEQGRILHPAKDNRLMAMIYSVSTPDFDNRKYFQAWQEGFNNG